MANEEAERTIVATGGAPAAIGPYSQAIVANGLVFTTGQIPLDPECHVQHNVASNLRRYLA